MDVELICRTCLSDTSNGVFITPTISNMIKTCAPVQISADDGLPRKICENCMKLLQVSFIFRRRILTVAANLEDYLQKKLKMLHGPYHSQPVNEECVEPPVLPSLKEKDMEELLLLNKMLQSVETEADSFLIDPLNIAKIEDTYFETDSENKIQPIEEVMIPINTNNVSTRGTIESSCATCLSTPTTTEMKEKNSSNFTQNAPISVPPLYPIKNIEHNSNIVKVKENDFNFIQNLVQSNVNVECIIVHRNSTNLSNARNIKQINPKQNVINQTSILRKRLQKETGNQSFEEELQKFVIEREKYLEEHEDAFVERGKSKNCDDKLHEHCVPKKRAVINKNMNIPALVYYKDKIKNS